MITCPYPLSKGSAIYYYMYISLIQRLLNSTVKHSLIFRRFWQWPHHFFLIHLFRTHISLQEAIKVLLLDELPCNVLCIQVAPVAPNDQSLKSSLCSLCQDLKLLMLQSYFCPVFMKSIRKFPTQCEIFWKSALAHLWNITLVMVCLVQWQF